MKKHIILIVLLVVSCGKDNPVYQPPQNLTLSAETEQLIDPIREMQMPNGDLEFITAYQDLKEKLDTTELIKLVEHKNPVIRSFAFKALVDKNYSDIRNILKNHRHDKQIMNRKSGCFISEQSVRSFMLSELNPDSKSKYKFDQVNYSELYDAFREKK